MKHQGMYGFLLLVLVVFIASIVGWYIWFATTGGKINDNNTNNTAATTQNTVTTNKNNNSDTANNTSSSTVSNDTSDGESDSDQIEETSSKSGNVTVTVPKANAEVASTISVSGYANVFENIVQIRVKDADGNILLDTFTSTNAPNAGKTGTFKTQVQLTEKSATKEGTLDVYTVSPKDGSEQDLVSVPIVFKSDAQL